MRSIFMTLHKKTEASKRLVRALTLAVSNLLLYIGGGATRFRHGGIPTEILFSVCI